MDSNIINLFQCPLKNVSNFQNLINEEKKEIDAQLPHEYLEQNAKILEDAFKNQEPSENNTASNKISENLESPCAEVVENMENTCIDEFGTKNYLEQNARILEDAVNKQDPTEIDTASIKISENLEPTQNEECVDNTDITDSNNYLVQNANALEEVFEEKETENNPETQINEGIESFTAVEEDAEKPLVDI